MHLHALYQQLGSIFPKNLNYFAWLNRRRPWDHCGGANGGYFGQYGAVFWEGSMCQLCSDYSDYWLWLGFFNT